eukprot:CAMPEP_0206263244 /NCGR_PEP_ID=MMETSP0047_2-20121206/28707_1 /ASSEMBLY_ACC=CAM_ASM_000192 /TAXON_ID=195065 /ORGANISM="Chroomonas mesostigmatica_cf, Strain CCMP1168" /LENGTH=40 /DNA_ID= /DNA_START= /DNA_END= /DNA_ORIENTATION=
MSPSPSTDRSASLSPESAYHTFAQPACDPRAVVRDAEVSP